MLESAQAMRMHWRWFLLNVLPFLEGDLDSCWALVEAVVCVQDVLGDNTIAYYLIE